ncbi:MAG: FG-GAP repeat domain-containing protein, partial [Burkholderiales bacterium]
MSIVISRTIKAALTALTLTVTLSAAQPLVLIPPSPAAPFAFPQGDIPLNVDSFTLTSAVVDLSGTGRYDIIVGNGVFPPRTRAKVPLRIFRPNGRGELEDVTRAVLGSGALPSTEHGAEIGTADLNGDGRPDLFVAASGYDTTPFDGEKNVLLLSRTDGALQDRSDFLPGPDFTHSTTSGDVNGDGLVDIFVGNVFGGRRTSPYFLMARQDGGYDVRLSLPTDINELRAKFTASLLADIDRDGRLDLVLGTDGDNGFTENIILFNDGTGDFTKRARVALPRSAFGTNQNVMDIVAQDINGDGYSDLVFIGTGRTPFYGGRFIQTLVNQGDGTFRDESAQRLLGAYSSATGPWNKEIRFVDLNGDGHLDFYLLMFVHTTREPVDMVWLNDGSGRFTPFRSTLLQPELGLLEATDLDGDGLLDFVLISGSQGRLQYSPVMNRTARAGVNTRRAKVDIDGDGREEILARASDGSTQMGRLVNGQFQFSTTTAPSSQNRVVAIADLNNNGRSDLVFQNITQGEFGEASTWLDFNQTNQRLLRNVKRVWDVQATGDLDGDGFGDLVWRYVVRESPDTGVSYIWFTNGAPNLTGTNVTQV